MISFRLQIQREVPGIQDAYLRLGVILLVRFSASYRERIIVTPPKHKKRRFVDYPPGGADPVHRHNASAFVYVLEGSVLMQMKDGEKVTLHPGGHVLRRPCRHLPRREKCERYCGRARKTSPTLS